MPLDRAEHALGLVYLLNKPVRPSNGLVDGRKDGESAFLVVVCRLPAFAFPYP